MKALKRGLVAALTILTAAIVLYLNLRSEIPEKGQTLATGTINGAALYAEHCAACHGANLEGQPNWRTRKSDGRLPAPPHDETGHTWHHPDALLFAITKHGTEAMSTSDYKSDMPGFGDILSDTEIQAVLDYIKSRWPEEIQRRQATITARQPR